MARHLNNSSTARRAKPHQANRHTVLLRVSNRANTAAARQWVAQETYKVISVN